MKEGNSPKQMSFSIEGNQFTLPENLSNHPLGPKIIETLSASSLFQERLKKGSALLIDYVNNDKKPKMVIYNPDTWQQTPEKPEQLINPRYSLIIFVLPSLVEKEDLARLINQNKKDLNRDGGEIFVLEMLSQPLEKDEQKPIFQQRKNTLKTEGWVKIAVTKPTVTQQNSPSFLLTQARLKKVVKHHEVDLLTPRPDDPKWKKEWRRGIIPKIIKMYQDMGFTKIDTQEIEDRLRHSKNPPDDLSKAEDGFGVEAKALCGCWIKVDINGTLFVLNRCSEHPNGVPNIIQLQKNSGELYFQGETPLSVSCGDCGANIIQTVTLIKDGKKKSRIGIEKKCPHCGLISYQEKSVANKSLIKRGRS